MSAPKKPSKAVHYALFTTLLIWATCLMLVAIVCFLTVVLIPVGIVLVGLGCGPLAAEVNRYTLAMVRWNHYQDQLHNPPRGKRHQHIQKLPEFEGYMYEYDPDTDQMVPIQKPWNEAT